jgi:soluble lytic murein transglycosylase
MKNFVLLVSAIFITQISYAQQDSASLAFASLNKGNCLEALSHANLASQELIKKIVTTRAILDEKCSAVDFHQAVQFINQNPNWSQGDFVKKRLENLVRPGSDKTEVFAWFNHNPPTTSSGFKNYVFAAPDKALNDPKIIKKSWINGSFNPQEKEIFLKKYSTFLDQADHDARIDNLLWSENIIEAKGMIDLTSKDHRKIYLARIAIIERSGNLDKVFYSLPKSSSKKDELALGALYDYLRHKRSQKTPVTKQELHLMLRVPGCKKHADKWWQNVICYYVRELIDLRRYHDAYRLASSHNCSHRTFITEAEFLSGWLSLRFLHHPKVAISHFKAVYNNSSRPITLSRGAYWTARAYKALRDPKHANDWFNRAAQYGHTFYGQMAQIDLNSNNLRLSPKVRLSPEDSKFIASQEESQIVPLLLKYNQQHLAMAYLKNIFSSSKDPKRIAFIMDSLASSTSISFKVHASRESALYGLFYKDYGYPTPYNIKDPLIELPLLYSIIRQESSFEQDVIDPTDGWGLMQLLRPTAKKMAQNLGIEYNENRLLKDIDYNIRLGSKYLADHIDYYNGSYLLGIPAYNAGTHRVDKWIARNGDPRKMKDLYSVLDWIEKIPFLVTRSYVQRIMENLQIYREIINKDSSLHIVKDLMHLNTKRIKNVKLTNKIASRR